MKTLRNIACVLSVLVLAVSAAAVAVSAPAQSAKDDGKALEKLDPCLKDEWESAMKTSPSSELRTLVFLNEGSDAFAAGLSLSSAGAKISSEYDTLGAVAAYIPASELLSIASSQEVQRICVDGKKTTIPVPDGDFASDFAMIFNPQTGIWNASTPYTMGVNKVWEKGVFGTGVRVAVLDTGVDLSQKDLAGRVVATASFTTEAFGDGNGHGTATAGLVASQAVNTYFGFIKVRGMAPGAEIMAAKVLTDGGFGYDSWIISGIEWAVDGPDGNPATPDGAQIISMSLGGLEVSNDGIDPTSLALDRAADMGVVSFVAAGNEGMGRGTIGSPGVSRTTITVGASTNNAEAMFLLGYWPFTKFNGQYYARDYENNHIIWFSSRGPTADGRVDPDVAAVGAWGPAIAPGNSANLQFGGTSMATPVAAGIGALVFEAYMNAHAGVGPTPAQMKAIMMGTAMDLGYAPAEQGAGRVDALKAYEAAIGERDLPKLTMVNATVAAGDSMTVDLGTNQATSQTFVKIPDSGFLISGNVHILKDFFYSFTIPEGVSYAHFDLAFDPILSYGIAPRLFTGPTFTDDHVNTILYKIENGQRVMINYAYAHTNAQEMTAKVTPGEYQFRVWGAQNVNKIIPFVIKAEYYTTTTWSWAKVSGSTATIKVPAATTAGTYMAYLKLMNGGTTSLIPVAITVPMTVGKTVKGSIDVSHDSSSTATGDWVFYKVPVPDGSAALTAVLAWADMNTDIDLYLIDPMGDPQAASLTPLNALGLFGPLTTSTGVSAQVVSVQDPVAGMWMIGLHDTFLGKVFVEPYLLRASLTPPAMFGDESLEITGSAQEVIANDLLLPISVRLAAVKNDAVPGTEYFNGVMKSIDIGGEGFANNLITVAPGTIEMRISITWGVPSADVQVVVYAADGSNRGILTAQGQELVVDHPVPGVWDAVSMLNRTGQETAYTLKVVSTAHPGWTDLSLSQTELMLDPLATETIVIEASGTPATASGMVVMYDAVTGSVYDTLAVTIG